MYPGGVTLDEPPPAPASRPAPSRMTDLPGQAAMSPQVRALAAMKSASESLRVLASVVPDVAPQLLQFLAQLEPLIAQAIAGGGTSPVAATMAMGGPMGPMPPPSPAGMMPSV